MISSQLKPSQLLFGITFLATLHVLYYVNISMHSLFIITKLRKYWKLTHTNKHPSPIH